MLKIRLARNKKELKQAFEIRNIVFGGEQKIPREIDFDGKDKEAKHALVFYNNLPIGCARIRFIDKKAKLERIAIIKKHRGKGFGNALVSYLISYCKRIKAKEIYFDSQYHARDFYTKIGFKTRGKPFSEAGIKHIEMYLKT
jgi:predicted GNAT family N-acyltransferase